MSKKTRLEKTLDFMAGKGFYIILIACVAAIGVSGYMLLWGNSAATPETPDSYIEWLEPSIALPVLEVTPDTDPVDGIPDDEGVISVIKPTGIDLSPAPPSVKPVSPSLKPSAQTAASPSPSQATTPKPKPTPTPKPADKTAPQFFWPVSGEVLVPYAHDELVFSKTMGDWRAHVGVDIAADLGAQVMAAADGIVKDVYQDPKLGSCVVIEHSGGMSTLYSNLQEKAAVQIDHRVSAGDVIGGVGSTAVWEVAEDSHLHFEVFKDGMPVDPNDWLPKKIS